MKIDLNPFKSLIKDRCGLHFEDLRSARLADGICSRMSHNGMESHVKYFDHLVSDNDEFHCLVNILTVNETYFFREPAHLDLLKRKLIPELLANRNRTEKIKVISAGCSTGEEPFSIAMAVIDKYGIGGMSFLSITGIDIDNDAISKADKGVFPSHSFRGVSDQQKEKYFDKVGPNKYKIKNHIREHVTFRNCNLLGDEYPEYLKDSDIVFYRNVSIYFEPAIQKEIFCRLASMLKKDGYLIVSSTETLSHNIGVLSLIELDGIFLYRKSVTIPVDDRRKLSANKENPGPGNLTSSPAGLTRTKKTTQAERSHSANVLRSHHGKKAEASDREYKVKRSKDELHLLFDEALLLAKNKEYRDSLSRIDKVLELDKSFIKAYMLKASILINMNQTDEAIKVCLDVMEIEQWYLEVYLLLGLIAKRLNNEDDALKRFREALYIQPSCWIAHFYMAEIYWQREELEKACREYEIVINILKKGDKSDHGFTFFPLSFPLEQLAQLCTHNLAELRKKLR